MEFGLRVPYQLQGLDFCMQLVMVSLMYVLSLHKPWKPSTTCNVGAAARNNKRRLIATGCWCPRWDRATNSLRPTCDCYQRTWRQMVLQNHVLVDQGALRGCCDLSQWSLAMRRGHGAINTKCPREPHMHDANVADSSLQFGCALVLAMVQ